MVLTRQRQYHWQGVLDVILVECVLASADTFHLVRDAVIVLHPVTYTEYVYFVIYNYNFHLRLCTCAEMAVQ